MGRAKHSSHSNGFADRASVLQGPQSSRSRQEVGPAQLCLLQITQAKRVSTASGVSASIDQDGGLGLHVCVFAVNRAAGSLLRTHRFQTLPDLRRVVRMAVVMNADPPDLSAGPTSSACLGESPLISVHNTSIVLSQASAFYNDAQYTLLSCRPLL